MNWVSFQRLTLKVDLLYIIFGFNPKGMLNLEKKFTCNSSGYIKCSFLFYDECFTHIFVWFAEVVETVVGFFW